MAYGVNMERISKIWHTNNYTKREESGVPSDDRREYPNEVVNNRRGSHEYPYGDNAEFTFYFRTHKYINNP